MSRSPRSPHPTAAVEALLRDLGPRLRRGGPPAGSGGPPGAGLATGIDPVDRLLGGGFPRGRLAEIAGPASSGRTSLCHALLARVTRGGEVAAWVDAADGFDPLSAERAGAALERLLWVRAPGLRQALASAEPLLAAPGFALVLLDLTAGGAGEVRPPPATWPRLARAAAASGAALVVLSDRRRTGTASETALELRARGGHFEGSPALLDGLEIEASLVRSRALPPRTASLRLDRTRAA